MKLSVAQQVFLCLLSLVGRAFLSALFSSGRQERLPHQDHSITPQFTPAHSTFFKRQVVMRRLLLLCLPQFRKLKSREGYSLPPLEPSCSSPVP